eukprot:365151-Chlamydomonas_euryale.AAC.12
MQLAPNWVVPVQQVDRWSIPCSVVARLCKLQEERQATDFVLQRRRAHAAGLSAANRLLGQFALSPLPLPLLLPHALFITLLLLLLRLRGRQRQALDIRQQQGTQLVGVRTIQFVKSMLHAHRVSHVHAVQQGAACGVLPARTRSLRHGEGEEGAQV